MKTSEKLVSVLCDPKGVVSINASKKDKEIIREAIDEVIKMEEIKCTQEQNIK